MNLNLNMRWVTPPGYFLLLVASIYIAATGGKTLAPLYYSYYWPYLAVLLGASLVAHVLAAFRPSSATHVTARTSEVLVALSGYAIAIWLVYQRYRK
jgi:predicted permease